MKKALIIAALGLLSVVGSAQQGAAKVTEVASSSAPILQDQYADCSHACTEEHWSCQRNPDPYAQLACNRQVVQCRQACERQRAMVQADAGEQLTKKHHSRPRPHPRPDHPHHRHPDDAKRQAMVDHINSLGTTWTAGMNKRFLGRPIDSIKRQLGVPQLKVPAHKRLPRKVHTGFDMAAIPTSFDSRTQWPNCPSIQEIRDQSDCGSCWAFGAVEAATDRICIGTKGAVNAHLSAEDLLSCCSSCGDGCNGGDPGSAWQYLASTGVVTGGNYNDFTWCSSYSMPNCEHHNNHTTYPPCGGTEYNTPACPTACDAQSTYSVPFAKDAHVFASAYSIGSDPAQIQQEIMTNGPVEVAFQVYSDFEQYTGGVYQHVSGDFLGGHAVKMIGWGVTDDGNNTPYWIIANSWNNDWGENGYFRILRGQDECGIEDSVVAGLFQA